MARLALTHSISAGLDYPSIGPEHAALADSKRAEYVAASDAEALEACTQLARTEGIIPALESSHAVAECIKRAPKMKKSDIVIVNISGRGDKDMGILRESLKLMSRKFPFSTSHVLVRYVNRCGDPILLATREIILAACRGWRGRHRTWRALQ